MDDPGLPIKLGPCSNAEFAPRPPSPVVREAARRTRAAADDLSRRLGMSRRRFLLSSMGTALHLSVLAACSGDSGRDEGKEPGGTFSVPPEATTEPEAATTTLATGDPVIDVQTHLLEYPAPSGAEFFGSGFPQADCGDPEPAACFGTDYWLDLVFNQSDTTMAVISAVPIVAAPEDDPLSHEVMARAADAAQQLCGDGRVLIQGHAVPNVGAVPDALAAMEAALGAYPLAAWKVYTHAGTGFRLDDDGVGAAFLEQVEELGVPIVSVHKGLSGGDRFASPADIGPAAGNHPALAFVVYHSGYESGVTEAAYSPSGGGVDRLVRSLADAGLGAGANVYAELGSTWRSVMGDLDQAAHVLGKLLAAVGEDNVLWGTDSIWYGSPQDQIAAFRAFEITAAYQDQFGYHALSSEVKAKILWKNAARLYGIDPARLVCRFTPDELESTRQESALGNRTLGPRTAAAAAQTWRADHPWFATP